MVWGRGKKCECGLDGADVGQSGRDVRKRRRTRDNWPVSPTTVGSNPNSKSAVWFPSALSPLRPPCPVVASLGGTWMYSYALGRLWAISHLMLHRGLVFPFSAGHDAMVYFSKRFGEFPVPWPLARIGASPRRDEVQIRPGFPPSCYYSTVQHLSGPDATHTRTEGCWVGLA